MCQLEKREILSYGENNINLRKLIIQSVPYEIEEKFIGKVTKLLYWG